MEDFRREYMEERFNELTTEARLKLLKNLPFEEQRMLAESLLAGLAERRKLIESLTVDERLDSLPMELVESHLKRRKREAAASKRKKQK